MKTIKTQKFGNNVKWEAKEGNKFVSIFNLHSNLSPTKILKKKYFELVESGESLEQIFCDYGN